MNPYIGTIDKLIEELTRLRETHGGETEVIVMQYTGGNEEPFYVRPVETQAEGDYGGRILLEIAGPQQ